jgi:hypothetical protein
MEILVLSKSWASKTTSIKAVWKTIGSCCFNGKLMLVIGSRIWAFGLRQLKL